MLSHIEEISINLIRTISRFKCAEKVMQRIPMDTGRTKTLTWFWKDNAEENVR